MEPYSEWIPEGALAPYVARIWSWDGPVPAARAMRFLPNGTAQIFLSFSDRAFESRQAGRHEWRSLSPRVFIGPQFQYFDMSIAPMARMAGVIFQPGGMRPFFEGSTSGYVDQQVPLGEVWRGEQPTLDDLKDASDVIPRIADWLTARLCPSASGGRLVRELTQWDGRVCRVDSLSERFHLSPKRLSRQFREVFGVLPKRFARVRRFNLALKEIFERKNKCLVDVADEVGCFDQAHLNREFRLFSGLSPAQYLHWASSLYYFPLLNEPA